MKHSSYIENASRTSSVHEHLWRSMRTWKKLRHDASYFVFLTIRRICKNIFVRECPLSLIRSALLMLWDLTRLPGAVILKMSHGYSINHDGQDPLVEIADYVLCTLFSEAVQAGKWLVDTVPFRECLFRHLIFLCI